MTSGAARSLEDQINHDGAYNPLVTPIGRKRRKALVWAFLACSGDVSLMHRARLMR